MTLHPQSQAFIAAIREAGAPTWPEMPVAQARQLFSELPHFGVGPQVAQVEDRTVTAIIDPSNLEQASDHQVPIRVYHHSEENPSDVIIYFHGGGWVLGNIETHDALCRRLSVAAQSTVVSVDYRVAPDHPFPAAAYDCFAVCQAISKDPVSFRCTGKLIVAGDSAGGNLAMATSLMFRDYTSFPLTGQVLIYPVLDGSMSRDSYERYAEGHGLTRNTMAWFWDMYTGVNESGDRNNLLASPMKCEDLSGLPRTHVLLAQYDVLRDEGAEMADRLRAAGVPTTLHEQPGMLHGFLHFAALFDDAIPATESLGQICQSWFRGDRM